VKTARKWIAIYVVILVAMILIAKYPYLFEGRLPQFFDGKIPRTLVMAAVGTGLIEIITYRVNQLKGRSAKRQKR